MGRRGSVVNNPEYSSRVTVPQFHLLGRPPKQTTSPPQARPKGGETMAGSWPLSCLALNAYHSTSEGGVSRGRGCEERLGGTYWRPPTEQTERSASLLKRHQKTLPDFSNLGAAADRP